MSCVVEAGGLGYEIFCSQRTLNQLTALKGSVVKINTYLKLKEDGVSVYGFAEESERMFFEKLLGVNGVGPKSALSILSLGDLAEISEAVENADVGYISTAGGIGKKTAQRIIVELKGKLVVEKSEDLELEEVLKSLGYKYPEYAGWVKKVPKNVTEVGKKVEWVLRKLGSED